MFKIKDLVEFECTAGVNVNCSGNFRIIPSVTRKNISKFLTFTRICGIKHHILDSICNIVLRIQKMARTIGDTFEREGGAEATELTRRGALRALLGGAAAAALTSLPLGKEAEAGEAQAATPGERGFDAVQGMRDMRRYAKDPNTQGIGVFINLQADAPDGYGDKIGGIIKNAFAAKGIPADYRYNRSRGTATDLTFYVGDYHFTINVSDLKRDLPKVYAHHQDIWRAPGKLSLNDTQPQ